MANLIAKTLAPAALCVATFAHAQSGTFTEPFIGCLTKNHLDQLYQAIDSGDNRLRDGMMGKTCVVVQGYEYSLLDRGFITSEIRLYVGQDSVDLIVPSEAVR